MAEALMKKALDMRGIEGWQVSSAGLMAMPGNSASENAKRALMEDFGIDIGSHRSKPVDLSLMADHDYVIALTLRHLQWLASKYGQYKNKIYFIGSFVSRDVDNAVKEYLSATDPYSTYYMRLYEDKIRSYEVEDPYGREIGEYKRVARQLWDYCCKIADLIEKHLLPPRP
ncbi:low molecular weight phosphotyrosine protein phosphatase [Acetomicrobium hydrogeniformans ATCC BAA-1850]|jgi:protein-tyrosine-phosphatase|nr:low molecular weight phosphotyrosine protein phosphatase [Acetomicrobium hydrogeniformans ATCC BAA-1850]